MKRVFLIVLDSVGIGEMPDASSFGDSGVHTLRRISSSVQFDIPNLLALGLGHIDGQDYLPRPAVHQAAVAKMREQSAGKDTTLGHWEIAGLISEHPMPTYPNGFPSEILRAIEKATGCRVLCNQPYSGTEVIKDYGQEHKKTGDLIVYTSADSVFQIAAHEEIVPIETLYEYCRIAREILHGPHGVGRVIARPFIGEYPNYIRTANRRDFSLLPPQKTMLDAISSSGLQVRAIGKIRDIFAGQGITDVVLTHSNEEGMEETIKALQIPFEGLCFVNLVEFDSHYGHRQDVDGYAAALTTFDHWLPSFISQMGPEDVLMITADHGCDPGDSHTDHTREYTPLLVYGAPVEPINLGIRNTFADIAATICQYLGVDFIGKGTGFWPQIQR